MIKINLKYMPETLIAVRALKPIHMRFVISVFKLIIVLTSIVVFS